MWKRYWEAWKRVGQRIGNLQARILLTFFYGLIVLPFGLAARFLTDPLRIKRRPQEWLDHPEETEDIGWARRQW
ncbi:MAG: hypothetical protein DMG23_15775 [Acidobacteria bacterium]|nr:MAG: hypothetical protein DMG23_15775 [Acidobacteriota bacterium]